jgi:hypothetical protein
MQKGLIFCVDTKPKKKSEEALRRSNPREKQPMMRLALGLSFVCRRLLRRAQGSTPRNELCSKTSFRQIIFLVDCMVCSQGKTLFK